MVGQGVAAGLADRRQDLVGQPGLEGAGLGTSDRMSMRYMPLSDTRTAGLPGRIPK